VERTESVVVQVHPDYENQKIQEMQLFGWGLQGRQEIEQRGEAYGRPSHLAEFTGTYVIKTTVHRFVKLHFVRSLSLPNLDRIKQLEAEYEALPFPGPFSLKGPRWFTAFWAFGVFPSLIIMSEGHIGRGLGLLVAYGALVTLGIYWLKSRKKKNKLAADICRQSGIRATQLLAEVQHLAG